MSDRVHCIVLGVLNDCMLPLASSLDAKLDSNVMVLEGIHVVLSISHAN